MGPVVKPKSPPSICAWAGISSGCRGAIAVVKKEFPLGLLNSTTKVPGIILATDRAATTIDKSERIPWCTAKQLDGTTCLTQLLPDLPRLFSQGLKYGMFPCTAKPIFSI